MSVSYMPSPRGGHLPHGHAYTNGYAGGSGIGAQPQSGRTPGSGVQGFAFRSRNERIDWKKIAAIDVERIMREFDVNSLQDSIMGITFCDIEREVDTRMVDQNFLTIFKLAQLIIQYLLHSQEVMAHNTSLAEERAQQLQADHEATRAELGRVAGELDRVKQESHKRKKLLKNQQSLIQATANNYHKCMYCQKAFFNMAYLQSHVQRKHPEFTPRPAQVEDSVAAKKVTEVSERLEKELDELRERLKASEIQVVEERERAQEQAKMAVQQHQSLQNQANVERHEEQHRKELERWKQEQLNFQKVENEKMQNMFMKELKEMHDKYTSSQTALENIQSKLGKQSMLGKIVDEDELDEYKKKSKKQERELNRLKEQLQADISSIQAKTSEDMRRQEEEWKRKQKEQRSSHKQEVKELQALLKQTKALLEIEREGGDKKGARYQEQMQELLKKNKDYERQLKSKEDKIKELKVKSSKHYEVVEPRSSPPPQMKISAPSKMEPSTEEDTDMENGAGLDTLSRVLQESESWLTGTHPSYNLSGSDVGEDELDTPGLEKDDEHRTFMKNKQRIMEGLKEELANVLQQNVEKRGVPGGMRGISGQSLENKVRVLKQERQLLAKQHAKFYDIREGFKREIDRKAAELRRSGKPMGKASRAVTPQPKVKVATPQPSSSTRKTPTSNKFKGQKSQPHQKELQKQAQKQPQKQPQNKAAQKQRPLSSIQKKKLSPGQVRTPPPVAPRSASESERSQGRGGDSRGHGNAPRAASRVSFEDGSDEEDESEEDDEEDDEESESFEEEEDEEKEESHYKTPNFPPRPVLQSQPATNGFHNGHTEGDAEEDSEWDSEEISELEEKGRPQEKPVAVRKPQGAMVSSLTRSIEMQLSGRRQGQKPVGGVDLGAGGTSSKPPQPAPRTPSPSPTPRIPTIPDAGQDDDDDDEDDSGSLSVSSLVDSFSAPADKPTSPTPAPRGGGSKRSNNDTDTSNTYGTSMWGSSKAAKGNGTGKSSLVSVTDFDDDDDFDLDEL